MTDVGAVIDYKVPIITSISANSLGPNMLTEPALTFAAAVWPTANLAFFIPFRIAYPYLAQKMFWNNGATVGTNTIQVGIYDDQGNQLVISTATTTSGANVLQSVSITPTLLQRGLYYMAMVMNGATDIVWRTIPPIPLARAWGVYTQVSAAPLPSPATFAGSATAYIPFLGLTSNATV